MRYLFFIVLLANVVFLLWEWRTAAFQPLIVSNEQSGFDEQDIVLLSEIESFQDGTKDQLKEESSINIQSTVSEDTLPVPQSVDNQWVCFNVGPFEDKAQVLAWDEKNPLKAENISFHLKDVEVVSGYLLFYPAAETILKAQDNVAIIEAKGVENLWLFRFGDMKGAISLGFFDSEEKAKITQASLAKLGVDANIKPHSQVKDHTFANIIWKKDKRVSNIIASYKEKFPGQEVKKISDCSIIVSPESTDKSG